MIQCNFCEEKAIVVAAQYHGGDITGEVEWSGVCEGHLKDWYYNIPKGHQISTLKITKKQHEQMKRALKDLG